MKKFYLLLLAITPISPGITQNIITVAPGTDLSLASGTSLSMDGLSVTPSVGFTLNGITLTRNASVTHPTSNTYASRVYQFSGNTNPFTGTVRFYYQDAELNGLSESSLQVNIHDGTSWQAVNSVTNDAVNNYVETVALSNQVMNELALADLLFALPLKWGLVTAYRESRSVKIGWNTLQEENVSHFSVEKSPDAVNWATIVPVLPAHNTLSAQQYSSTDNDYSPLRLFYRIKQTDIDGQFSYSRVVAVEPDGSSRMVVYPNPVTHVFYISNINPALVRQVRLYNSAGMLLKTWTVLQPSYDIQTIPRGIYQLQVLYTDGRSEHTKINKQ
jgi:hypothetical protein